MEIRCQGQEEECRVLNCAKEELEVRLPRVTPQFPEEITFYRGTTTLRCD
jgi:hypothetical protein